MQQAQGGGGGCSQVEAWGAQRGRHAWQQRPRPQWLNTAAPASLLPPLSPAPLLQLQRSTRELSEAQRELALARSRAEGAVKAADAAQSDAAQKLQKLDEEVSGWGQADAAGRGGVGQPHFGDRLLTSTAWISPPPLPAPAGAPAARRAVHCAAARHCRRGARGAAAGCGAQGGGAGGAAGDGAGVARGRGRGRRRRFRGRRCRSRWQPRGAAGCRSQVAAGGAGGRAGAAARAWGCFACSGSCTHARQLSVLLCFCASFRLPTLNLPHHQPTSQETAAAATGHAKQFELLAQTSEEALRSMQGDHDKFKAEAAARCVVCGGCIKHGAGGRDVVDTALAVPVRARWGRAAHAAAHTTLASPTTSRFNAANEEIERLRGLAVAKEGEAREAKAAEQEFAAECDRLDKEFAAERQRLLVRSDTWLSRAGLAAAALPASLPDSSCPCLREGVPPHPPTRPPPSPPRRTRRAPGATRWCRRIRLRGCARRWASCAASTRTPSATTITKSCNTATRSSATRVRAGGGQWMCT